MPADTDGSWRPAQAVPFKPGKIVDKRGKNPIDDNRGLFVIHAAHLHTGKVLWFCGHTEDLDYPLQAYLFDPRKPAAAAVPLPFPGKADLFCCHYVQLADGRILIVGGSQLDHIPPAGTRWDRRVDYRGSTGASTIAIFDPRKEEKGWEPVDSSRKLIQARWYPTAVLLGDGSVLVFSGRRELPELTGAAQWPEPKLLEWITNRGIADKVEHLRPPSYKPQALTGASRMIPIYPGIHLAPDDRLYTTHTTWGQEIPEPPTLSLTVVPPPSGAVAGTAARGTWTEYVKPTARARQPEREEGMSVMLPVVLDPATKKRKPDSVGKFLVIGGGFAVDSTDVSLVRRPVFDATPPHNVTTPQGQGTLFFDHQKIASRIPAEILDTSAPGAPQWKAVSGLSLPRINGHCVLLPDATVLILGGHDNYKWNAKTNSALAATKSVPVTTPTLPVEIFTPGTGFRVGAAMAHPRMYHSVALLLVDGSVIVAGGADPNEHEPSLKFPLDWEGRSYFGLARMLDAAGNGAATVQLTLDPSPYLAAFADIPAGTKVIISPDASPINTTVKAIRPVSATFTAAFFLDIDPPLPRAITKNTRVEFTPATAGTPIPRRNEWVTRVSPPVSARDAPTQPLNRKDYEIYQPPYFHLAGTRPVLPPLKPGELQVRYGTKFTVRTPDAARITRVAIMRPACVTHHTDSEQRFIELPFTASGSATLQVDMVPGTDSSLVPPGYYMLWILAGALPCVEARFIQVVGAPPLRSPTVPVEVDPPAAPATPPAAPPATGAGSDCPLAVSASTNLVALLQLAYLRQLRSELVGSPVGRRFVVGVDRPYHAGGAPLARWLRSRDRWRAAVRDVVLGPLTATVRLSERLARRRADQALRRGRLVVLLSLVGLGGLLLAPLLALAGWLHVVVHRRGDAAASHSPVSPGGKRAARGRHRSAVDRERADG